MESIAHPFLLPFLKTTTFQFVFTYLWKRKIRNLILVSPCYIILREIEILIAPSAV